MLEPVTPNSHSATPPAVPPVPDGPSAVRPALDVPAPAVPRPASMPATAPSDRPNTPPAAPSRSNSVVPAGEDHMVFNFSVILAFLVFGTWVVLALMGAKYGADVTNAQSAISTADTQMKSDDLAPTVEQYQSLDAAATNMATVRKSRYLLLPTWNTLKAKVPKDVQFTSVSFGQDNIFRISGLTNSFTSVANFAKALESEKGITDISPLSVDKESGSDRFQFTLTFKATPVITEAQ